MPVGFCEELRPSGEAVKTIKWMLQGQCYLLMRNGYGHEYTTADFGLPGGTDPSQTEVYDAQLPSIKKTKEAILSKTMKPGPHMHDA